MVKTVLLNDDDYKLLVAARDELLLSGIGSLDAEVVQTIQKKGTERLTMGSVVGISAILLKHCLKKKGGEY